MHQEVGSDELDKDMVIYDTQQNFFSISHLLGTVTTQ